MRIGKVTERGVMVSLPQMIRLENSCQSELAAFNNGYASAAANS